MILTLAGNKEEFDKFLENHEPKNIFRYVSKEADYEGHKQCDMILVGSYENNPLWKEADLRKKMKEYCSSHGVDIVDYYIRRDKKESKQ